MKKIINLVFVVTLLAAWITTQANSQEQTEQQSAPELVELWHVDTDTHFEGRPAIDGDFLFVGGKDGLVRKLDRGSGKVVWTYDAKAEIGSSLTVDEERVYFSSWDGTVHAIMKSDGTEAWQFKTGGEKQWDTWDHRLSTPTVDHERIYFGSGDHYIYGLNKRNGAFRWKVKTGGIIHSEAALDGDKVIVGSYDGKLYGVDRANGKLLWTFKTVGNAYFRNGAIAGSPLVADGVAYFGSRDYNLYGVLTSTGTGAWNYRTASWVVSKPLLLDGNLYITNSDAPGLMAIGEKSGREKWKTPLNLNSYGRSVGIGTTYVATSAQDGRVYLMKRDGGDLVASYDTPSAQANRDQYFDKENKVLAQKYTSFTDYEAKLHKRQYELGAINSGLVAKDNIIYISNMAGDIVALEVKGVTKPES